jgi:hypothetical protein
MTRPVQYELPVADLFPPDPTSSRGGRSEDGMGPVRPPDSVFIQRNPVVKGSSFQIRAKDGDAISWDICGIEADTHRAAQQ